jgi:hypothetical protein
MAWPLLIKYGVGSSTLRGIGFDTSVDLRGNRLPAHLAVRRFEFGSNRVNIFGLLVMLAALAGCHVLLLYLYPTLCNKAEVTVPEATTLAADNILHGYALYVGELFDWRFGEKVEHTTASGTVFFLLRLACDADLILLILLLRARWQVRPIEGATRRLGRERSPVERLREWLTLVLADARAWATRYPEEHVFFVMIHQMMSGEFDAVATRSPLINLLAVDTDVRCLLEGRG